ncbi:hypothetical protein HLB44_08005 [Aquincola sp. S2]|uniref:DUF2846 domain-containing protein n=1 Tax=Pseudaquabacterium terrae TaxID=2732868 RepID=A0ABX2EE98_9BURK|nr:hypothetical protein [Aquabacterium terrae]NRF66923.1 hypothetical protein [Aquabacterium terrae]
MPTTAPTTTRRSLLAVMSALAAGAGGLLATGCATAEARPYGGLAALEVYDRDSGQVLPTYHHDGRRFVPGRPGARYALRLRNLTGARVLVVLSVDGVNVISGETADWSQTGYVLDPGRSYDINGWRKSGTQIAAFEFAPIEHSYAALTGRPGNVGVIGMAVFRERVYAPPPPPVAPPIARSESLGRAESRAADAAAPAAPSAQAPREKSAEESAVAGSRLGTGHGQREWSVSQRTRFERASSSPEQLSQLEYDSHERLVAAGIIPGPMAHTRPRPFPSNQGFVPDPPQR